MRPEEQYRHTTDRAERRRIQAEILDKYRTHVRWFVRKTVRPEHREEAEQVGCIGLLVALEKYEPARLGVTDDKTGGAFWFFAARCVRDEIRRWEDVGVYWRKRPHRAAAKSGVMLAERRHESADAEQPDGRTLHDKATDGLTVEDLVADAEHRALFARFVRTLTDDEREILFSEDGRILRSRGHLSLIERARAFVMGENDGDVDRAAPGR